MWLVTFHILSCCSHLPKSQSVMYAYKICTTFLCMRTLDRKATKFAFHCTFAHNSSLRNFQQLFLKTRLFLILAGCFAMQTTSRPTGINKKRYYITLHIMSQVFLFLIASKQINMYVRFVIYVTAVSLSLHKLGMQNMRGWSTFRRVHNLRT